MGSWTQEYGICWHTDIDTIDISYVFQGWAKYDAWTTSSLPIDFIQPRSRHPGRGTSRQVRGKLCLGPVLCWQAVPRACKAGLHLPEVALQAYTAPAEADIQEQLLQGLLLPKTHHGTNRGWSWSLSLRLVHPAFTCGEV